MARARPAEKRLGKLAILRPIRASRIEGAALSGRRRCVCASRGVASRPQENRSGHLDGVTILPGATLLAPP
jgi:hypothetical protein